MPPPLKLKEWLKKEKFFQNCLKDQHLNNFFEKKGFQPFDFDAILIPLDDINEFSNDLRIKNAIENEVKFYVIAPDLHVEYPEKFIIDPKVMKINGAWHLHGRNIRMFTSYILKYII